MTPWTFFNLAYKSQPFIIFSRQENKVTSIKKVFQDPGRLWGPHADLRIVQLTFALFIHLVSQSSWKCSPARNTRILPKTAARRARRWYQWRPIWICATQWISLSCMGLWTKGRRCLVGLVGLTWGSCWVHLVPCQLAFLLPLSHLALPASARFFPFGKWKQIHDISLNIVFWLFRENNAF